MTIIQANFPPSEPCPPEPPGAARFRMQREREIAAAVMQRAVLKECEGEFPLPYPMPYHWSAEKVRHFATGGSYPQPAFIATIGTRVSAFRKPAGDTELRMTA
jgi:hypothetical protein